jgi:AraC-like DNA-binding protein
LRNWSPISVPFLPLPAGELHNQIVDVADLWDCSVYALRDQLLDAATSQAKLRLMEQALVARMCHSTSLHPAVLPALHAFQQSSLARVEAVAEQIGLTSRRLHQIFYQAVGVAPKLFQRLQRFQHVLRRLNTHPTVDWADLAVESGYYDQAHLIHDFQHFAALTPTAYLTQPSREMPILTDSLAWRLNQLINHVPLNLA